MRIVLEEFRGGLSSLFCYKMKSCLLYKTCKEGGGQSNGVVGEALLLSVLVHLLASTGPSATQSLHRQGVGLDQRFLHCAS